MYYITLHYKKTFTNLGFSFPVLTPSGFLISILCAEDEGTDSASDSAIINLSKYIQLYLVND